ncbi:class E sortase [Paenarthrobacter sp. CCNWLY172]|uniref:class E sortase n=1 Tax=Paenarthrobacter sp. OM7 TaxID=3041264 RepID=UPI00246933DA|nr:class E sortase [Paenarthrobacter sp. OM7]WGM22822.1 class E sortase [Paenarthrobacter sp. OM7]
MRGDAVAHQQTTATSAVPSGRRGQEETPRTRLRASDVIRKLSQILGELLITAGVVLLLFVGWQLWWTNVEADAKQAEAIQNFAQQLTGPVTPSESATPADYGDPVVGTAPANGETIGIMYIPRFGADYTRPIIEGTGADVLDTLGLGHYGSTSMPGAIGNFAVAGHRQTHGAVLDSIHTLVPGDKIYVQTADGYYTYVFRNNQIVLPNRTDVLLPVPTQTGVAPEERILTMTSCNPRFGSQERIIAYSVMESWQPASAGPPSDIAAQVAQAQGKG